MTQAPDRKRVWTTPRVQIAEISELTRGGEGSGIDGGTMIGMAMISDARVKREIAQCGMSEAGFPLHTFRYLGGGPLIVGVLAQDVLQCAPDAVTVDPTGVMRVHYDRIGIDPAVIPV